MRSRKPLTSEERRAKALAILAKGGHLPPCRKCGGPDDRREENKLCRKCHLEDEYAERERLREKQRLEEREELYGQREGAWG